jgi:glycosyltransferase involved in cell wall biosynthesis
LKRRPLTVAPFYVEETAEKIRTFLRQNEVDLIVLEESFIAPYMDSIPRNYRGRVVIDFHNVASHQFRSIARLGLIGRRKRLARMLDSFIMPNWEGRYASRADHCFVVSEEEARRLRNVAPRVPISVVANGIQPAVPLGEAKGKDTLLFVGTMAYEPNADAMRYFCASILPLIRMRIPKTRLYIVGIAPPADIRAFGAERPPQRTALANALESIVVTGEVRDVRPYYDVANIMVVPLRAGGGTRLKILEAMALGRPVVSTSLGCEGLAVKHGEHIMIADEPRDFADTVVELLENPTLARRLCRNARRLIESHYDWSLLRAQFSRTCAQNDEAEADASNALLEGVRA